MAGVNRHGHAAHWMVAPLLLALCCAAGCEREAPPSLLLIVADTARADGLGCHGGSAHTPHLCELARQGVLFENAYSSSNWTLPASVSMFTGDHPTAHTRAGTSVSRKHDFYWVEDGALLLAEVLSEHGYENVAFLENALAATANTFQGFEEPAVDDAAVRRRNESALERSGIDLTDPRYRGTLRVYDYLLNRAPRAFFAVQWFMDPHAVYDPPEWFAPPPPAEGALPRPLAAYRRLGSRGDPETGIPPLPRIADELTPAERTYLRALYDSELESVDERVGLILEGLERGGRARNTFVVFTSDHGEGFGEHGRFLHGGGRWLYEEFIRIPLVVRGPGVPQGRRIAGPVSLVDLMPTLCELLEVQCLNDAQGQSFRAVLTGEAEAVDGSRGVYVVGTTRRAQFDALIRGGFKLILTPRSRQLYDLRADPGERRDLSSERPEIVAALAADIGARREETEVRRRRNGAYLDPRVLERASRETLEQLRALGYVDASD